MYYLQPETKSAHFKECTYIQYIKNGSAKINEKLGKTESRHEVLVMLDLSEYNRN